MRMLHHKFWRLIAAPKVSEAALAECMQQLKNQLPSPVFWLIGKVQSGKSSIVRALTGSEIALIGNGFQACTKNSRIYHFPDPEHCLLRFLDTRGLGEVWLIVGEK